MKALTKSVYCTKNESLFVLSDRSMTITYKAGNAFPESLLHSHAKG